MHKPLRFPYSPFFPRPTARLVTPLLTALAWMRTEALASVPPLPREPSSTGDLTPWLGWGLAACLAAYVIVSRMRKKRQGATEEDDSSRPFRDLFRSNITIKLLVDPEGARIVDANEAACEFYGYTHEQLTQLRITDINTLDEKEIKRKMASSVQNRGGSFDFVHRLANGEQRRVQVMTCPLMLDGRTYLCSLIMDITRRKEAEEALATSEFRLEEALALAKIGCWEIDAATKQFRVFHKLFDLEEAISGRSGQDTLESLLRLTEKSDRARIEEGLAQALETGKSFEHSFPLRLPDGGARTLRMKASLVRDKAGKPVRLLGVTQDVTSSLALQRVAHEKETLFRHLMDNARDGINICHLKWEDGHAVRRLYYCNDRFVELSGYTKAQLERCHDLDTLTISREPPGTQHETRGRFEKGETARGRFSWKRPDKRENYLEWVARPVTIDGEPFLVGIDRDITERVEAEREQGDTVDSLRQIIDLVPVRIYLNDIEGRMIMANKAAAENLGHTPETLAGKLKSEVYDEPAEIEQMQREDEAVIREGRKILLDEKLLSNPDGSKAFLQFSKVPFKLKGGDETLVLGVAVDVTDRKTAEWLRQEYTFAMESLASGKTLAHTLSRLISAAGKTMTGAKAMVLIENQERTGFRCLAPPGFPGFSDRDCLSVPEVGSYSTDEELIKVEDLPLRGHIRVLAEEVGLKSCWTSPIISATSENLGLFLLFLDREIHECRRMPIETLRSIVTIIGETVERDQAIQAKRRSDFLLEYLFNNSRDGFCFMMHEEPLTWDGIADRRSVVRLIFERQKVTRINEALARQYGGDVTDFVGKTHKDLAENGLKFDRGHMEKLLEKGELHTRLTDKRLDGTTIEIERDYRCIYNEAGRITGHFVIQRDITRRLKEEEHMREARRAAEAANKSKSEFLAAMSHEIRTPLNSVIGFSSLLQETELDAEQIDYVKSIQTSGDALLTLLNDILDLSKIEANKLELDEAEFSLGGFLDDLLAVFSVQATRKALSLDLEVATGMPQRIIADESRIRQVLFNLLGNAMKFTSEGGVLIRVSAKPAKEAADGRESIGLRFEIKDSGIGISPENLQRIFTPFTQADSSTTRTYGGTGLGLSISQRLVRMMGGEIQVESEEGVGSLFRFEIAVRLPRPSLDAAALAGLEPCLGRVSEPIRALIVEDDAQNRKVAKAILEQLGCSADVAENGERGVGLAKDNVYDVILMDLHMAGQDGFETARRIRTMEEQLERRPSRIIALTADVVAENRKECTAAGMDDFLSKPVKVAKLANLLEKSRTARRA